MDAKICTSLLRCIPKESMIQYASQNAKQIFVTAGYTKLEWFLNTLRPKMGVIWQPPLMNFLVWKLFPDFVWDWFVVIDLFIIHLSVLQIGVWHSMGVKVIHWPMSYKSCKSRSVYTNDNTAYGGFKFEYDWMVFTIGIGFMTKYDLTHWGRVTHMCVCNLTTIC